jgi:fumarate reductase flavoprotein subunit
MLDGTSALDKQPEAPAHKTARRLSADVLVVGAGTAGIPTALFAADRGARVVVLEAGERPGGTLKRAAGHLSAGGTRLQREAGIEDSPEAHAADIMRITGGTADHEMVELACDLAPGVIDWLDKLGMQWSSECPAILHALEPYSVPRTYWGPKRAVSIARTIVPPLDAAVAEGRISLLNGTRLTDLTVTNGAVTGATAVDADGQEIAIEAAQTVLTSGGYAADAELFPAMTGGLPLFGGAEPTSRGDGLRAARSIGAQIRPARHFLPHVGGIEDPPGSRRVSRADNPALMPHRQPWEIYVDRTGARCLREDEPDRMTQQKAMTRVPEMTFWIVWDSAIDRQAPPLLPNWDAERLARAWGRHPSFTREDRLADLAKAAGIDPAGLEATVARYNADLAAGLPDLLGREYRPLPIKQPPFFAVRNHGTTATASGGLAVDRDLRVLDSQGRSIAGLFAAGEVLGRELLSGNAFVGGMSITPALAFGRRLGERVLAW